MRFAALCQGSPAVAVQAVIGTLPVGSPVDIPLLK
jgi:hypothetical protein